MQYDITYIKLHGKIMYLCKKIIEMKYINRQISELLSQYINNFPAVAILGPRQCGKSTLARHITKNITNSVYLDLEKISDRNKLNDPEMYFKLNSNKLVCLYEIQKQPEIFSTLRSIIDNNNRNGQFLILGSASRDLIRQSSETLAGRIVYIPITPFALPEIQTKGQNKAKTLLDFWVKGGFPRSYLTKENTISMAWRNSFIETFLQRDLQQIGFNIPPETALRLWKMCAHSQGQILNTSKFGNSLGLNHMTVKKYLDIFHGTFMLRILNPFFTNTKKRLIKSPKIYIRDTGILHALLNIHSIDDLYCHPVYGSSWETLVIENVLQKYNNWDSGFYRTANGAEIDLVLEKGLYKIAIECKASSAPKPTKGFYLAMEDLKIDKGFIIAPIDSPAYPLNEKVTVISLNDFLKLEMF